MSIFRIHHINEYTVISNHLLRDENLSLKTLGLFVKMLSLPSNWQFSAAGLEQICKDGKTAINSALKELEKYGYLKRSRNYTNGKLDGIRYDLYELPQLSTDSIEGTCEEFEINLDDITEVRHQKDDTPSTEVKDSKKVKITDENIKYMSSDEFYNNFKSSKDFRVLSWWTRKTFPDNEKLCESLIKWVKMVYDIKRRLSLEQYNDKLLFLYDKCSKENLDMVSVVLDTTEKGYYSFQYTIEAIVKNKIKNNKSYQYTQQNTFDSDSKVFGVDRQFNLNTEEVF